MPFYFLQTNILTIITIVCKTLVLLLCHQLRLSSCIIVNMTDLKLAIVCSSNQNRSMEAHNVLSKRGFSVRSFGAGSNVKLPGTAADKPNIYDFSTTYEEMYRDLVSKDKDYYTQNGILHMLERNKRIKPRPEKFQLCHDRFDVIITCEERIYDLVIEDVENRPKLYNEPVHVLNIDIEDNPNDATLGAFLICDLCTLLRDCSDMDDEIEDIIQRFESQNNRSILHTIEFI